MNSSFLVTQEPPFDLVLEHPLYVLHRLLAELPPYHTQVFRAAEIFIEGLVPEGQHLGRCQLLVGQRLRLVAQLGVAGKLCGAGGGGFMIFFVEPERQLSVKRALSQLLEVPFKFGSGGSQLIFNGR
ncbi:hypothetical protein ES708_32765 [subsurface metagenome]